MLYTASFAKEAKAKWLKMIQSGQLSPASIDRIVRNKVKDSIYHLDDVASQNKRHSLFSNGRWINKVNTAQNNYYKARNNIGSRNNILNYFKGEKAKNELANLRKVRHGYFRNKDIYKTRK